VITTATRAMRQQSSGNAAEMSQAYTGRMEQPGSPPLTGYRIAVTSSRRSEELCALLSRQGAEVSSAAAINMIALPEDEELQSNTEAVVADPPDILVAHTGIGFRGWLAAAEGWGLSTQLITSLSKSRVLARGPKATGALRAAGLQAQRVPKWCPSGCIAGNPPPWAATSTNSSPGSRGDSSMRSASPRHPPRRRSWNAAVT